MIDYTLILKIFNIELIKSIFFCIYRDELDDVQESFKQTEREKSQVVEELTEQNQRLTSQLKEVGSNNII